MSKPPVITEALLKAMDNLVDIANMYYSMLEHDPTFVGNMEANDTMGKILREALEHNFQSIALVRDFIDRYERSTE